MKNLFIDDHKFDELSADILPNQILKTTLQNLTQFTNLSPSLRHEIRTIIYRLEEINVMVLTDTISYQV